MSQIKFGILNQNKLTLDEGANESEFKCVIKSTPLLMPPLLVLQHETLLL